MIGMTAKQMVLVRTMKLERWRMWMLAISVMGDKHDVSKSLSGWTVVIIKSTLDGDDVSSGKKIPKLGQLLVFPSW